MDMNEKKDIREADENSVSETTDMEKQAHPGSTQPPVFEDPFFAGADEDGNYIYYCHLAERTVRTGARIEAGQQIGVMGTTGYSTGVHLHFEVRDGANRQLNAAAYLGIENRLGPVVAPAADSAAWSDEAVAWAQKNGIIYGDGAGNLMLDEPCTRREMVVFLHRLWKLVQEQ